LARVTAPDDAGRALTLCNEALEKIRSTLGPNNLMEAWGLGQLAEIHQRLGDAAAAEEEYRRSLDMLRTIGLPDHPYVADGAVGLADILVARGDGPHALPLLEEAVRIRRACYDGADARITAVLGRLPDEGPLVAPSASE
jgi:tetratricopeptide (TPR) repeat protein